MSKLKGKIVKQSSVICHKILKWKKVKKKKKKSKMIHLRLHWQLCRCKDVFTQNCILCDSALFEL